MRKVLIVLFLFMTFCFFMQSCSDTNKKNQKSIVVKGYVQPDYSSNYVVEAYKLKVIINDFDGTAISYSLLGNNEWFDCNSYVSQKNPSLTWGYNWCTVIEGKSVFFKY